MEGLNGTSVEDIAIRIFIILEDESQVKLDEEQLEMEDKVRNWCISNEMEFLDLNYKDEGKLFISLFYAIFELIYLEDGDDPLGIERAFQALNMNYWDGAKLKSTNNFIVLIEANILFR